jgi:hypothetical protein
VTSSVTAPETGRGGDRAVNPAVDALIQVATARFTNLGYLGPDGLLDVPLELDGVSGIRLQLPPGRALRLQAIGLDGPGATDMASIARVVASSREGDGPGAIDPAILFDIDRPAGPAIHTRVDQPAWAEVRFARRVALTRLRLRNVSDETAREARGLKVTATTRWRTRVIYNGSAELRDWRSLVARAKIETASDPERAALLHVLDLTVRGEYARAHQSLAHTVADEGDRRWFRVAVNRALLPARGLEWTVHGPTRPFRAWSPLEQEDYVRDSASIVEALQALTPDVCLGFGSVLAVVRDRALIPHDDDLDIIVGFEPAQAETLSDGLRLVEAHLRSLGYEVTGRFAAHRHVRRPGGKRVDVFVGLFEEDAVSWYPGARGGLTRSIVFPPRQAELLGVRCTIPAQPETYLERLYGEGWRVPDPHFNHDWNLSGYEDIAGTSAPASAGEPEAP